ncbi:MAG: hypothetical protein ACMG57_04580 [Candidatus Dojkabacteria bacterium]
MDQFNSRALTKEFRTQDSVISIFNHKNGITIQFGSAKYLEDYDGVYNMQINIPFSTEVASEESFKRVSGIVKESIRSSNTGVATYVNIVEKLYKAGHVDESIFDLLKRKKEG